MADHLSSAAIASVDELRHEGGVGELCRSSTLRTMDRIDYKVELHISVKLI